MAFDPGPIRETSDDPEDRVAFREAVDRVAAEKKLALLDPGPTWKEWFYFSAMKVYLGLAFMILDSWLVVGFLEVGLLLEAVLATIGAVYLEFLCYRFLWRRPPLDHPIRASFRPTWHTPVQFGRWTPEGERFRAGLLVPGGPDPREFL
jgi:hypothetical protein